MATEPPPVPSEPKNDETEITAKGVAITLWVIAGMLFIRGWTGGWYEGEDYIDDCSPVAIFVAIVGVVVWFWPMIQHLLKGIQTTLAGDDRRLLEIASTYAKDSKELPVLMEILKTYGPGAVVGEELAESIRQTYRNMGLDAENGPLQDNGHGVLFLPRVPKQQSCTKNSEVNMESDSESTAVHDEGVINQPDQSSGSVTYETYADVPWHRKQWLLITLALVGWLLVWPGLLLAIIQLAAGDIYYMKSGQLKTYSQKMKIGLMIALGIILIGKFLIRY